MEILKQSIYRIHMSSSCNKPKEEAAKTKYAMHTYHAKEMSNGTKWR